MTALIGPSQGLDVSVALTTTSLHPSRMTLQSDGTSIIFVPVLER
jgi:hypothetical protein